MNIQLKQAEIVEALKQYIAKQGINLSGKEVNITFTAGRKEAGITADLVIEDAGIPGFTDSPVEDPEPAAGLSVVGKKAPDLKAANKPEPAIQDPSPSEADEPTPVAKTTSLFS